MDQTQKREIKFRAYSQKAKEMRQPFIQLYPTGFSEFGMWTKTDSSLIIMQYTGLRDKNGKEIYEGDILEYKNELGRHHKYKVFYKQGGLCINIDDKDFDKEPSYIFFYSACADMQTRGWIEQCEVIGNIYEKTNLIT